MPKISLLKTRREGSPSLAQDDLAKIDQINEIDGGKSLVFKGTMMISANSYGFGVHGIDPVVLHRAGRLGHPPKSSLVVARSDLLLRRFEAVSKFLFS